MNLIQQQDGRTALCPRFRINPAPFPKAGERGTRVIASGIDSLIAKLRGKFQKQCGLANLPRPGQDLNPPGSRLAEPLHQYLAAMFVAIL